MKLLLDEMHSPAIARRTRDDVGWIAEAKIKQYPGDDGLANAEDWL